jgi:hypothetical protein
MGRKVEMYSDGVGYSRDAQTVGVGVAFELIHFRGKFEQLFIKTRFSSGRALHRRIVSIFAVGSFKREKKKAGSSF